MNTWLDVASSVFPALAPEPSAAYSLAIPRMNKWSLLFVALRDVAKVRHEMARTIQPSAGEIEWRTWTVYKSQRVLVTQHGLVGVAGRHIVTVTPTLIFIKPILGPFRREEHCEGRHGHLFGRFSANRSAAR